MSGDRYYTNGVRLWSLTHREELPYFLPRSWREGLKTNRWSSGWVLGQQIYTPEDIQNPNPQPNDRPWAAWLYAGGLVRYKSFHHLYELEVTLGVVGPGAGGRQVQSEFHRLIRSPHPEGWDHQIVSKPTLQSRWDYTYLGRLASAGNHVLEGHASWGCGRATSPRMPTAASCSSSETGPPWDLGLNRNQGKNHVAQEDVANLGQWGWYAYAQWGLKAVSQNLLIQGETPTGNPTLAQRTYVREKAGGFGVFIPLSRRRSLEIVARRVHRSEEFVGQRGPQKFGTISLVWHTKF